jgi:hypothetical protein
MGKVGCENVRSDFFILVQQLSDPRKVEPYSGGKMVQAPPIKLLKPRTRLPSQFECLSSNNQTPSEVQFSESE